MSNLEVVEREDIFSRYDSGLIAGFEKAQVSAGAVCAVTPVGIELVARYEDMNIDIRTSWSQVVKLFKGDRSD